MKTTLGVVRRATRDYSCEFHSVRRRTINFNDKSHTRLPPFFIVSCPEFSPGARQTNRVFDVIQRHLSIGLPRILFRSIVRRKNSLEMLLRLCFLRDLLAKSHHVIGDLLHISVRHLRDSLKTFHFKCS